MVTWKAVKGYEGSYEVSDTGLVRSLDRYITSKRGRTRFIKGKELRLVKHRATQKVTKYYRTVALSKDGVALNKYIHRLVAEAFLPNPDNKEQVNHINKNTEDCKLCNLEWVTAQENTDHKIAVGGITWYTSGDEHHASKLTWSLVKEIYVWIATGFTNKTIGSTYGVDPSVISRIRHKKAWVL